jgi:hypothetical protein
MVEPFLFVPMGMPPVHPSSAVGGLFAADAHPNASRQATHLDFHENQSRDNIITGQGPSSCPDRQFHNVASSLRAGG